MLGIVETSHVAGGTNEFFRESQACYLSHMPGTPPGLTLTEAGDVQAVDEASMISSGLFDVVGRRDHVWDETFPTAEAYLDVLDTYSGHITLVGADRTALYACLTKLIESRYAGSITKRYLFRVTVGRRRD